MKKEAKVKIKRPKKKYPIADAILTADIHLTHTTPISRTDNYILAQENKLRFLQELSQENNNCPILCAGDVFDHWKASPWLCSWAHQHLPSNLITIPGNHDLPMHSFNAYSKSALSLLETVGGKVVLKGKGILLNEDRLEVFGIPFGEVENHHIISIKEEEKKYPRGILLLHELTWEKEKPPWASNSYSAKELLRKFGKDFDLIVTGDNHQSFAVKGRRSLLVNPGSMMRRTTDQVDFQPRCYLYYAENNTVIPVDFPIEKDVHALDHLIGKKERDARITAYIETMKINGGEAPGFCSFRDNLQCFFQENKTPRKVREIIWRRLETV